MASLSPYNGVLGARLAKHLLKRATYNITKDRITEFSVYTPAEAVAKLAEIPAKNLTQPIHYPSDKISEPAPWIDDDPIYGEKKPDNGTGNNVLRHYVLGWWIDEARRDTSYRSKLTYFLHTNFTASNITLNGNFGYYYDYLRLLEFFSLGSWKELVFQITINPIMLYYLNNNQNTEANPNENYARELLELFTIGKGPQTGEGDYTNYTESDVEQAARVLTGWRFQWYNILNNPNLNRYKYSNGVENGNIPCGFADPGKHDFQSKQFSYRFGNYTIDAWDDTGKTSDQKKAQMEAELRTFIDMILGQGETAKYICRKLYRYYVSRDITAEIENDIIVPLATKFRENYNMQETVDMLFKSKHFYDMDDTDASDEVIGSLIKSPLDLILQTLTVTDFPVPDPIAQGRNHYHIFYYWQIIGAILIPCSQNPFDPPSVAGFPPNYESPDFDRFWFNSSTIIPRYNFTDILLNPNRVKANFYISDFVENNVSNPLDPDKIVKELTDIMFPESVDAERHNYFLNDILLEGGETTPEMWADEWQTYKNTGIRNGVESVLVPLFKALVWSQEFQTN